MKYFTRLNCDRNSFANNIIQMMKPIPEDKTYEELYKEQYQINFQKVRNLEYDKTLYEKWTPETLMATRCDWFEKSAKRLLPKEIHKQIDNYMLFSWGYVSEKLCNEMIQWATSFMLNFDRSMKKYEKNFYLIETRLPDDVRSFLNHSFHDYNINLFQINKKEIIISFDYLDVSVLIQNQLDFICRGELITGWKYEEVYLTEDNKIDLHVLLETGEFTVKCSNVKVVPLDDV